MAISILDVTDPDPNIEYIYSKEIVIWPKARVIEKTCTGFTKLMACVCRKELPCTYDNVNAQNGIGYTALMYACIYHHPHSIETIRKLIESGAELNTCDKDGYTALMHACMYSGSEYVQAVDILMAAGADTNVKNLDNDTALIIYLKCGFVAKETLINLMIKSQTTITDANNLSKTALDYYQDSGQNILDEYELEILKGNLSSLTTKSARF